MLFENLNVQSDFVSYFASPLERWYGILSHSYLGGL